MKPRTIIGLVFIVASLTKLATIWGFIKWEWFSRVSEEPWVTYFTICLLIYVGVSLVIDSYRRDPDQWLQRPLPIGEDGKRICCSVRYGGDEYIYRGEHSTVPGSMLSSEASEWTCGMQPLQRMKR